MLSTGLRAQCVDITLDRLPTRGLPRVRYQRIPLFSHHKRLSTACTVRVSITGFHGKPARVRNPARQSAYTATERNASSRAASAYAIAPDDAGSYVITDCP
jgi:hypothetical protein